MDGGRRGNMVKVEEIKVEIQVKWNPLDPADCQRANEEIQTLDRKYSADEGYQIYRANPIAVKCEDTGTVRVFWHVTKKV